MVKIFQYLIDNGIYETIKRITKRIFGNLGLIQSESYILAYNKSDNIDSLKTSEFNYKIEELKEEQIVDFNKIKYYNFIDGKKILTSNNFKIFVAMDGRVIMGYICCQFNINHQIHNMGSWNLNEDEAWIGPTYVLKRYRNKNVHKELLEKTINNMNQLKITTFYTAINKNNIPSIKSFSKAGFKKIGIIKIRRVLNKLIKLDIIDFSNKKTVREKFCGYRNASKYRDL